MAEIELLTKALDSAHWELGESLSGMPDDDLWQRASPQLWSVGELVSHIGYWEAMSILGDSYKNPLFSELTRYHSLPLGEGLNLPMSTQVLVRELSRVHLDCSKKLIEVPLDTQDLNPLRGNWTWGETLTYQAFHVAYHTGQIYSVRHLFNHETPDN